MEPDATSTDRSAVDRLLDATLESIHFHGFGQTTVSTVTELAGLSRGMVRHEFGSKQAMVTAAMTRLCRRWLEATEPDESASGPEQVRMIVRAMFAPDAFQPIDVDAWLALSVEAGSDPELRALRESTQARWIEQLAGAYAASGVADPDQAAHATLAAADGLWLQHRLDQAGADSVGSSAIVLRLVDALLGDSGRP